MVPLLQTLKIEVSTGTSIEGRRRSITMRRRHGKKDERSKFQRVIYRLHPERSGA